MKRNKILKILFSKGLYSILSISITVTMLSGITVILRNDIKEIKAYVRSIIEGDPNYKKVQESVSESMHRGVIDIEAFAEDTSEEKTITSSGVQNGYDNFTPSNNSSTSNNSSSTNNSSLNSTSSSNSNNSANKEESFVDKSAFSGQDVIISEGQPFNPMNALQLSATDIDGKNITNSIVIEENNVDIYKPGVYNVKAYIELKNNVRLNKKFVVRVEPTVLDLAVNNVETSKIELQKNEKYNMNFDVYSSKSYLDVEKVVINKEEYEVNRISQENIERYEVNLEASSKAGTTTLKLQKVIMSDGTVVDTDKKVNVEVLKEDAYLTNVVVEDRSSDTGKIKVAFQLMDIDDTIKDPKIHIYNEKNELVVEKEFKESTTLPYTKLSTTINVDKAGDYIVKVVASRNILENEDKIYDNSKIVELLSKEISVNLEKSEVDNKDETLEQSDSTEDLPLEESEGYSLKARRARNSATDVSINDSTSHNHQIAITGNIADYKNEIKPGTVQVVVPTTASFKVDNNGNFTAPSIIIKNNGEEAVDVYAYKFIDVNGTSGINIKSEQNVTENPEVTARNNISLNISGRFSTAYFKSEDTNSGKNGVYEDSNLTKISENGIKISTVHANSSDKLTLNGKAGKESSGIDTAIKDTFTLILKIKKSTN
ncbi:hypothetical protein [Clostridium sp.]|uniref:hypothetical protein n=1 Tax=Clostridium sp. TaxID=1506 RepID=UPI002606F616|nr:hypothetical protein [Clostridium sp.]